MDEHTGFGTHGEQTAADEERLIRGADLVLATSRKLEERLEAPPPRRPACPERRRRAPLRAPAVARLEPAVHAAASGDRLLRSDLGLVRRGGRPRSRETPPGLVLRARRRYARCGPLRARRPPERSTGGRGPVCRAAVLARGVRRLHDPFPAHAPDRGHQSRQDLRVFRDGQAGRRAKSPRARALRRRDRALRHIRGVRESARARGQGGRRARSRGRPPARHRAGEHVAGPLRGPAREIRKTSRSRAAGGGGHRVLRSGGGRRGAAGERDPAPRRRHPRARRRDRVSEGGGRGPREAARGPRASPCLRDGDPEAREGYADPESRSGARRVPDARRGAGRAPPDGPRGARALGALASGADPPGPHGAAGRSRIRAPRPRARDRPGNPALRARPQDDSSSAGPVPSPHARARRAAREAREAAGRRDPGCRPPGRGRQAALRPSRRHRLFDHRLGLPLPAPAAARDAVRPPRPPRPLSLDDPVPGARGPRLGSGPESRERRRAPHPLPTAARHLSRPAGRRRPGRPDGVVRDSRAGSRDR